MRYLVVILPICLFSLLLLPLHAEPGIEDDLIAYFPLDGNARNLVNQTTCHSYGDFQYEGGISGLSAVFDDVDDYIRCPPVMTTDTLTSFSISLWAKHDINHTSGSGRLISQVSSHERSPFNLFFSHSTDSNQRDTIAWYLSETGLYADPSYGLTPNSYQENIWYHIVVTYDGSSQTAQMYINGDEVALSWNGSPIPSVLNSEINDLIIGNGITSAIPNEHWYFGGKIDEIRIYGRVLEEYEIDSLHTYGSGTTILAGLVSHYEFEGNGNDTVGTNNCSEEGGASYGSGILGSALILDGDDDYLRCGPFTDSSLDTSMTISLWANRLPYGNGNDYLGVLITEETPLYWSPFGLYFSATNSGSGPTDSVSLYLSKDGITSGTAFGITEDVYSARDTWYHIAATYDGNTQQGKIYVNGSEADVTWSGLAIPNSLNPVRGDILIGNWITGHPSANPDAYPFGGKIDDLRVYNRALSSAEIRSLHTGFSYTSGSLHGYISASTPGGSSTEILPDATIELANGETTSSDENGYYQFTEIEPGTYEVTVSKAGYYSKTRQISVEGGDSPSELFSLVPKVLSIPTLIDFDSETGSYIYPSLPGDMHFSAYIDWAGSPGTVRFQVAGVWQPATVVNDLGDGLARAELTLAFPEEFGTCNELLIEIENGEGESISVKPGVYFYLNQGFIPWLPDAISWETSSSGSYKVSESKGYAFELPLKSDDFELSAGFGYEINVEFTPSDRSMKGSLAGGGTLEMEVPTSSPNLSAAGGVTIKVGGGLERAMAGCGEPPITAFWEVGFEGAAGIQGPVVVILDAFAPPAGTTLASIPGINELELKAFKKVGGTLLGVYEPGGSGTCFLGSDNFTGDIKGGPEAILELSPSDSFKTGVYVGGEGLFKIDFCDQPDFKKFTGKIYAGAFAEAFVFKANKEISAEVTWDFTNETQMARVLTASPVNFAEQAIKWEPIGDSHEQWGQPNRLVMDVSAPPAGITPLTTSGPPVAEEKLVENVVGVTSPSIYSDAEGDIILYTNYDTEKDWFSATDIGVVENKSGSWSLNLLTDDLDAEFGPKIVDVENTTLLSTWTRVHGDISETQVPEDIYAHLEIVTSHYDKASSGWSAVERITNNSVVDRDPLPIVTGTDHGILWIQNAGAALPGNISSGDSLLFSSWLSSTWSSPVSLFSSPKGIISFSYMEDSSGEGHIVFALDEDGNNETTEDREIYRISTISGIWQPAVQLTSDAREDSLPTLVNPHDTTMLVWKSGDTLKYSDLISWSPQEVYPEFSLANEAPTLDAITMPGGAAIAYTVQTPQGVNIFAAFYDASLDTWSLPRQMTSDEHSESSIDLSFDGTELVMVYLKTETVREDIEVELNSQQETLANIPQPGRVDLYILRHTLGNDIMINPDAITVSPENPAPNTTATISATLSNVGEIVAENIPLSFYDGDPDNGGLLIAETTSSGLLIAGGTQDVAVPWVIPQGARSHELFAVVDPALTIEDRNRLNNVSTLQTTIPDLVIEANTYDQLTNDTVALKARIANQGVIPTGSFDVTFHLGAEDGPEIGRVRVTDLLPGTRYDAVAQWLVAPPVQPDNFVPIYAVADLEDVVSEFNETNNSGLQSVKTPLYTSDVGYLVVDILPPEAIDAGIAWSVDNGTTWYESGTILTLLPGTYSIFFKSHPDWSFPPINNVVVEIAQTSTIPGNLSSVGDLNGDDTVDLQDAIIALQLLSGSLFHDLDHWFDVNINARVDLAEAIYILRVISGFVEPPVPTVTSATGKIWMDRNLGASQAATALDDPLAYGDLYQWGRLADGHENRLSGLTSVISTTDTPGHGDFIYQTTSPYDWRNPQNDNLWQGSSGINTPCPSGFRLPTRTELEAEVATWSSNDAAGAFTSPLKLVLAGYRYHEDGTLSEEGTFGGYWTSTVEGSYVPYLGIDSESAYFQDYMRADGFSVRCIKE